MKSKTPIGKIRGLGASGGVHHWMAQRVSAIALIPLVIWFIVSITTMMVNTDMDQNSISLAKTWISSPMNALASMFFVAVSLYHGALGMRVIFEDYIHSEFVKTGAIIITNLISFALSAGAIFAVLSIYFKG